MPQRPVVGPLVKRTSATSSGSTQCARRAWAPRGGFTNAGVFRKRGSSLAFSDFSVDSSNPVPTLPE